MRYVLIGHITADRVGQKRYLGGTVAYASPIAHAFGLDVALLTSATVNDPLLTKLSPTADLVNIAASQTTTFENRYDGQQRCQYVHAVANRLTVGALPRSWLTAPLVHFAPLVEEVDLTMIRHFSHATTLLTLQGCLRQWNIGGRVRFKAWFDEAVLRSVDIVVLSRQDIEVMPSLEAAYAQVTKHLIITDGVRGGVYYRDGEATPYQALPATETDPTGAGDVFAATVLASLPHVGYRVEQAIKVAAFIASVSVQRTQATMHYSEQLIQQALAYAHEVKNSYD